MKTLEEIKHILSGHREELRQNYEVKDIGIFGSVAGESRKRKPILTSWYILMAQLVFSGLVYGITNKNGSSYNRKNGVQLNTNLK